MTRLHRITTLSLAAVLLVSAAGAAQAKPPASRATLDGEPIASSTVARWQCHDLAVPHIHCFRSIVSLRRDIRRYLDGGRARVGAPAVGILAVAYVRVYEDANYGGGSAYLSQDYTNLGTIGWNDRITSFKVLNGGSGTFREHAGPAGASYGFCCAQQVSNIGSTWNDAISAVSGNA